MKTVLSLLMPTTPERGLMFGKLYTEVRRQFDYMKNFHSSLGEIEIIIDASLRFLDGGLSIGKKRESLVKKATGRYCVFLDSDDHIAPNYLETSVRLCNEEPDICTFRNFTRTDNYWCIVDMSLKHDVNEETGPMGIIKRRPWPICPVRTEFAKRYDFEDVNYSEDWLWFQQVLTECKTESHTNSVLHEYHHSINHSEADQITRHELDKHDIRA